MSCEESVVELSDSLWAQIIEVSFYGHLLIINGNLENYFPFIYQVPPRFILPRENRNQATSVPCYSSIHLYNYFQIFVSSKSICCLIRIMYHYFSFLTFEIHTVPFIFSPLATNPETNMNYSSHPSLIYLTAHILNSLTCQTLGRACLW